MCLMFRRYVQEVLKSCPLLKLLDCSFCEQLKLSIRQLRQDQQAAGHFYIIFNNVTNVYINVHKV